MRRRTDASPQGLGCGGPEVEPHAGAAEHVVASALGQACGAGDSSQLETTWTEGARERAWSYVTRTLLPRQSRTARVWVCANMWHEADVPNRLAASGEWKVHRTPALDQQGGNLWGEEPDIDAIYRGMYGSGAGLTTDRISAGIGRSRTACTA